MTLKCHAEGFLRVVNISSISSRGCRKVATVNVSLQWRQSKERSEKCGLFDVGCGDIGG